MRHRSVCLLVAITALSSVTMAQSSRTTSSSTKSTPDPIEAANKPLTPKSAMPAQHKSSIVPPPSKNGSNTTAELTHLEQQNIKASTAKSGASGPVKGTSKSTSTSAASHSGINFKYQKPVGGPQAPNGAANSKSSGTPRVTKK
jgi:hypothetical protein